MLRVASLFLVLTFAVYATDETQRPFRNEDSRALIQMLSRTYEDLPPVLQKEEDAYEGICEILLQRKEIGTIVTAYSQSTDARTRQYLATRVLYHIQDPAIVRLFRSRLSEEETEESYYVTNYIAKLGDEKALVILNRHYFRYPISSFEWSSSVELFGKFGYRPAIPNLIGSLEAASLNHVGAAIDSLKLLFPDTPKYLKTITEYRDYFIKRLREEKSTLR